jgi:hypothetical protein
MAVDERLARHDAKGTLRAMLPRRPRALLGCAAVALLLAAVPAGCGQSDEEEVRDTLKRFETAVRDRDYKTLCDDVLAKGILDRLQAAGAPCEVVLERGFGTRLSPSLTIHRIRVRDDVALAEVTSTAVGEKPARVTLRLVWAGDDWRLASLSGAQPPAPSREPREIE